MDYILLLLMHWIHLIFKSSSVYSRLSFCAGMGEAWSLLVYVVLWRDWDSVLWFCGFCFTFLSRQRIIWNEGQILSFLLTGSTILIYYWVFCVKDLKVQNWFFVVMFVIAPSGVVFLVLDFSLPHHVLLIIQFPMCAVLHSVRQLSLGNHESHWC